MVEAGDVADSDACSASSLADPQPTSRDRRRSEVELLAIIAYSGPTILGISRVPAHPSGPWGTPKKGARTTCAAHRRPSGGMRVGLASGSARSEAATRQTAFGASRFPHQKGDPFLSQVPEVVNLPGHARVTSGTTRELPAPWSNTRSTRSESRCASPSLQSRSSWRVWYRSRNSAPGGQASCRARSMPSRMRSSPNSNSFP